MSAKRTGLRNIVIGLCLLALAGCSATYRNHGYIPLEEDLQKITVGVDTRASVEETVGAPTTGGVLDDSAFYYVQSRMRHFAYQRPQVVKREVVAISFDRGGVVRNIERFTLEDGNVVPISRRVTDSSVVDTNILRQLMSKLGRFSADSMLGN
ncbi:MULTISPECIES: outer membrane protein assembly factor BamE [Sediminimonas]|uniref:Outer membrane protein assembly factor BamE n=1 Tax=Sediminimonas qiaohouensis TaxID=552061 RepID=A0A7C9L7J8_9RHOB|nr:MULTISPECIES: outer membrane protein assembly factor BamE [Sediminimonas]MDR9484999.1 outer membrane protein assembly factor BamE [Sediminimonas sp.]MTJ04335.1 outer membrane protein assembly factor BamE [Sediminimonas qiaohouensis]